MADRITRPAAADIYDRDSITRALGRMAARGRMLENMGVYFWTYRRCEPVRAHFACVYVTDEWAAGPDDEQRALAEHDGWEFVCTQGFMHVYVNFRPSPEPMHTDPEVERRAIEESALAGPLPALWLLLVCAAVGFIVSLARFLTDAAGFLADWVEAVNFLAFTLLLLVGAARLALYHVRKRRSVRLPRAIFHLRRVFSAAAVLWFGYVLLTRSEARTFSLQYSEILLFFAGFPAVLAGQLRRRGISGRRAAEICWWAFIIAPLALSFLTGGLKFLRGAPETEPLEPGEAPFTLEDFGMGEAASVLHEYESSPLVTVFSLRTYAPDMELRLIIPRTEGLGGLFERQIIKAEENKNLRVPVSRRAVYVEADEPAWDAEQVWRVTSPESGPENRWLLRCDNALAELELPFTPTQAQSAQISEQIAAWAACRGSRCESSRWA